MKTIFKYQLIVADYDAVVMPEGFLVRHLAMQGSVPTLWAEVDTEAPKVNTLFRWFGTGHTIPDDIGDFVGTVLLSNGLVFHLYKAAP